MTSPQSVLQGSELCDPVKMEGEEGCCSFPNPLDFTSKSDFSRAVKEWKYKHKDAAQRKINVSGGLRYPCFDQRVLSIRSQVPRLDHQSRILGEMLRSKYVTQPELQRWFCPINPWTSWRFDPFPKLSDFDDFNSFEVAALAWESKVVSSFDGIEEVPNENKSMLLQKSSSLFHFASLLPLAASSLPMPHPAEVPLGIEPDMSPKEVIEPKLSLDFRYLTKSTNKPHEPCNYNAHSQSNLEMTTQYSPIQQNMNSKNIVGQSYSRVHMNSYNSDLNQMQKFDEKKFRFFEIYGYSQKQKKQKTDINSEADVGKSLRLKKTSHRSSVVSSSHSKRRSRGRRDSMPCSIVFDQVDCTPKDFEYLKEYVEYGTERPQSTPPPPVLPPCSPLISPRQFYAALDLGVQKLTPAAKRRVLDFFVANILIPHADSLPDPFRHVNMLYSLTCIISASSPVQKHIPEIDDPPENLKEVHAAIMRVIYSKIIRDTLDSTGNVAAAGALRSKIARFSQDLSIEISRNAGPLKDFLSSPSKTAASLIAGLFEVRHPDADIILDVTYPGFLDSVGSSCSYRLLRISGFSSGVISRFINSGQIPSSKTGLGLLTAVLSSNRQSAENLHKSEWLVLLIPRLLQDLSVFSVQVIEWAIKFQMRGRKEHPNADIGNWCDDCGHLMGLLAAFIPYEVNQENLKAMIEAFASLCREKAAVDFFSDSARSAAIMPFLSHDNWGIKKACWKIIKRLAIFNPYGFAILISKKSFRDHVVVILRNANTDIAAEANYVFYKILKAGNLQSITGIVAIFAESNYSPTSWCQKIDTCVPYSHRRGYSSHMRQMLSARPQISKLFASISM